ncbi:MAG: glycosyltransferase family 2 protein [Ignavibacteria bacterium]|nr:glycosyltransferase family 2 protein [Ignavibacteria bacterium]
MQTFAPIALFVYKRLYHTRKTIESLLLNPEASQHRLIIYSDAPKRAQDKPAVQEVRNYLKTIAGFRSVEILERIENAGLSRSIIEGVTDILQSSDSVIILEDDLELSPYFLRYMNEALDLYASDEKVASIHGYMYPSSVKLPETFFMRGADCWGWGTWKRAWKKFNPDGKLLLQKLLDKNLIPEFDNNGKSGNLKMLKKQIQRKNDSWAIRWHASIFLEDMYTLYPGKSLVRNIGNDGQGTHSKASTLFEVDLSPSPVKVAPVPVTEDKAGRLAFAQFYNRLKPALPIRFLRRIFYGY